MAQAIEEHYLPRFAGDRLPEGQAGLVVGLADRLDTLVGLFSAGVRPSGAADPGACGVRRWGSSRSCWARASLWPCHRPCRRGRAAGAGRERETLRDVTDLWSGACACSLLDAGFRFDAVDAVLAERAYNPALAEERCAPWCLGWVGRTGRPSWIATRAACASRAMKPTVHAVEPQHLGEPAAVALYEAYRAEAPAWPRPTVWTA